MQSESKDLRNGQTGEEDEEGEKKLEGETINIPSCLYLADVEVDFFCDALKMESTFHQLFSTHLLNTFSVSVQVNSIHPVCEVFIFIALNFHSTSKTILVYALKTMLYPFSVTERQNFSQHEGIII